MKTLSSEWKDRQRSLLGTSFIRHGFSQQNFSQNHNMYVRFVLCGFNLVRDIVDDLRSITNVRKVERKKGERNKRPATLRIREGLAESGWKNKRNEREKKKEIFLKNSCKIGNHKRVWLVRSKTWAKHVHSLCFWEEFRISGWLGWWEENMSISTYVLKVVWKTMSGCCKKKKRKNGELSREKVLDRICWTRRRNKSSRQPARLTG